MGDNPTDTTAIKNKIEKGEVTTKDERRGFTIRGRQFWMTKAECFEEFGAEDAEAIWKSGERERVNPNKSKAKGKKGVKREAKAELKAEAKTEKPKEPGKVAPSEDAILKAMTEMEGDITSTRLRDHFALDKETGRGIIRHAMAKLAKEGKVKSTEKEIGKRKQFVYELVK